MARWWAEVLGYRIRYEDPSITSIAGEHGPGLSFVPVVHSKGAKNRLHIDLAPDDRDAEIERLVDMGARHVEVGKHDASWIVLADPEGNEFCVLTAAT